MVKEAIWFAALAWLSPVSSAWLRLIRFDAPSQCTSRSCGPLLLSASRVAMSDNDGLDFQDYERECFGVDPEEGCDAWFYGEDPDEEKQEPTAEEAAAAAARGEALKVEMAKQLAERQARQAALEALKRGT